MSTKLDQWIETHVDRCNGWSIPISEAIAEYRDSRQWIDGPPPEGCDAAWVVLFDLSSHAVIRHGTNQQKWLATTMERFIYSCDILRHWPIPPAPPLPEPPKPAIPEEVAKNGDGCYRIGFTDFSTVVRRVENNHVLREESPNIHVTEYQESRRVKYWTYLGDIPLEVAKNGDGWYWRDKEVVHVICDMLHYALCGSSAIRDLTNDGRDWQYIPERKVGE